MHPLISEITKEQLKRVPEIKTGYTIRVHQKITEGNKERIQIFEGLVIGVGHGAGTEKTMTVRKIVQGIGVEKIFPIHSPNITKIEIKKKAKVRRAKLYYMRNRSGKSARLQERHVTAQERAEEEAKMEASIQEAVKADEKKKAEEAKNTDDTAEETSGDDAVEAIQESPQDDDSLQDNGASQDEKNDAEPTDKPAEDATTDEIPAEGAEELKEEAPAEEEPTDEGSESSETADEIPVADEEK